MIYGFWYLDTRASEVLYRTLQKASPTLPYYYAMSLRDGRDGLRGGKLYDA
jgi:hypothetical protein